MKSFPSTFFSASTDVTWEAMNSPAFESTTIVDISLARPWTFYEYLEPLTVHYDGGVSLLGLALGQGEEQLAIRQQLLQSGSRIVLCGWVLQWQTSPWVGYRLCDIPAALQCCGRNGFYQEDVVLRKATNHCAYEPVVGG